MSNMNNMNKLMMILITAVVCSSAQASRATDPVDARCQAPNMSLLDESNCYYDAVQHILHGDNAPDSIVDYCHAEEGGACDDFNGLQQTECMNACIYHQLAH